MKLPSRMLHNDTSGEAFVLNSVRIIRLNRDPALPIIDSCVSRRREIIRLHNGGFWHFNPSNINGLRVAVERQSKTINTTALVHETWLRLQKSAADSWRDQKHFHAAVTKAMCRILADAVRRHWALAKLWPYHAIKK